MTRQFTGQGEGKTGTAMRSREDQGWRQGKPVEDPQKTKKWGYVTAKPSEYLVHVRKGRIRKQTSGQGATCFKWPTDSVAIVPTSLQQLCFVADQVTLEKVGVQISGLAVYRIAEPELAYRVLNFSFPERAQEKLEETLTAMLRGATRRLVANLSVDDCLQKRKSALAEELLRELAPVVGGSGRPDDTTRQGWGIVIDSIEIQEVRVMSERVFADMQAPFRAHLQQRARLAKAEAEREVAAREAECRSHIAEAEQKAAAEIRARESEIKRREAEQEMQDKVAEQQRAQHLAEVELATMETLRALSEHRGQLAEQTRRFEWNRRNQDTALALIEGKNAAEVDLLKAKAERERAEAQATVRTAENLPHLAAAVGQKFGEVKLVHLGEGNPFGTIAQAITGVLELARRS